MRGFSEAAAPQAHLELWAGTQQIRLARVRRQVPQYRVSNLAIHARTVRPPDVPTPDVLRIHSPPAARSAYIGWATVSMNSYGSEKKRRPVELSPGAQRSARGAALHNTGGGGVREDWSGRAQPPPRAAISGGEMDLFASCSWHHPKSRGRAQHLRRRGGVAGGCDDTNMDELCSLGGPGFHHGYTCQARSAGIRLRSNVSLPSFTCVSIRKLTLSAQNSPVLHVFRFPFLFQSQSG